MSLADRLTFTSDWVSWQTAKWMTHLEHLVGQPHVHGLEVGVYEGRSSLWWLENILTGPGSTLTGIEPCRAFIEPNLKVMREAGISENRYYVHFGMAQSVLAGRPLDARKFDFAYIDGGKEADCVLQNSVLTWLHLAPGAILIWDDYQWEWKPDNPGPELKPDQLPRVGIDAFLSAHAGRYEELHRGWQIIIRKL